MVHLRSPQRLSSRQVASVFGFNIFVSCIPISSQLPYVLSSPSLSSWWFTCATASPSCCWTSDQPVHIENKYWDSLQLLSSVWRPLHVGSIWFGPVGFLYHVILVLVVAMDIHKLFRTTICNFGLHLWSWNASQGCISALNGLPYAIFVYTALKLVGMHHKVASPLWKDIHMQPLDGTVALSFTRIVCFCALQACKILWWNWLHFLLLVKIVKLWNKWFEHHFKIKFTFRLHVPKSFFCCVFPFLGR